MMSGLDKFIASDRNDFLKGSLDEENVPKDPYLLFRSWLKDAIEASNSEAYAVTLSTINDNKPKSRVLFLRSLDDNKFTFYTNYESNKGVELSKNGNVCLSFFWSTLERQVIVYGRAMKSSNEKSDAYFASRPRSSQIGAWSSNQSRILQGREELESRVKLFEEKFKDQEIPRPDHWGGYDVLADEIEFWQGRASRLHDRLLYKKYGNSWTLQRMSP